MSRAVIAYDKDLLEIRRRCAWNSGDTILISARCPAGKHRGL